MSIRRCRARRHIPAAGEVLATPEDALALLVAVLDEPRTAQTAAVLLGHDHAGLGPVVLVEGATTVEQVTRVAELVATVARDRPVVGAVVLATVRPGDPAGPRPADHHGFFELRALCEAAGVALLDWFLFSEEPGVASVAELTDARVLWRAGLPDDA